nr:hypothetical protein Q903MT_gene3281 [Picea sitchensis]
MVLIQLVINKLLPHRVHLLLVLYHMLKLVMLLLYMLVVQ